MGRLKAWQNLNPLFAGKYKKLLEEYGSKDYSKLLVQESVQDFISYNCGHCGHMQKIQAEEFNNIVGHALRLAYTAHLQKSTSTCGGSSLRDVISSTSASPGHHHQQSFITTQSSPPTTFAHACRQHSHSRTSHRQSKHSCEWPYPSADRTQEEAEETRESEFPSSHSTAMRTPNPSSTGGSLLRPPSSLPGLHFPNNGNNTNSINNNNNNNNNINNNIFHSPESDTSNSPTELNRSRRLGEKPPLIKNVNISLESNPRLEGDRSSEISSRKKTPVVGGYVNDKRSAEGFTDIEKQCSDAKCRLQDDCNIKSFPHNSHSSKFTPGNITIDCSNTLANIPPPLPERSDSLTPPEEPHLKSAAWFQAGIPREIALEVLNRESVGAFMVRESTSKPGCYALSLRVPKDFTATGIAHYLIVKTTKGYKIKGFTKEFTTLTALITHHSVMPELLPCPLSLSRYHPSFAAEKGTRKESKSEVNEDDPDYDTMSDFRKVMADLNV